MLIVIARYVSYLLLLLPNVIGQGLIKNMDIIGDPFYTSKFKPTKLFSFDFNQLYVLDNSIFDSKTEIFSLGELLLSKVNRIFNIGISNIYIVSSILILILILMLLEKILCEFQVLNQLTLYLVVFLLFILWGPFFPYSLERPISPQVIILIWASYLLLVIIGTKKVSFENTICTGFIAGISLYVHYPYLYLQIQFGTLLFIFLLLFLKVSVKPLIKSLIFSWILSIPYIYWSLNAQNFQEYEDLLLRGGLIHNHLPSAIKTVFFGVFTLLLLLGLLKRCSIHINRRKFLGYIFLCSQVITCIALSNSNLVSGISIQFSDHFEVFIKFLMVLAVALYFNHWAIIQRISRVSARRYVQFLLPILFLATSIYYINLPRNQSIDLITFEKEVKLIDLQIPSNAPIVFDNIGLADIAGALLPNPLLTNANIISYNFSQKEINQRYFANSGCSSNQISESSYSHMYGFRIITERRKLERVYKFLNKENLLESYRASLAKRISLLNTELDLLYSQTQEDFSEVVELGCINFLRERNIQFIISQSPKIWSEYYKNGDLELIKRFDTIRVYGITQTLP